MIELINTTNQTVDTGAPVVYSQYVKSGCAEYYRAGSGTVKLIKPGRYLVTFSANLSSATAAGAASLSIAEDGEAIPATTMTVTPAAAGDLFNVSAQTYVTVPNCCGNTCCAAIAVENTGALDAIVDNPNLTVVRVNG